MRQFYVKENEAGQRLDKLLVKYMSKAPKSFIYKMLRKKNIVLNGKKADGSEKVMLHDQVKLFLADETIDQFKETIETKMVDYVLDIVYEDKHIMVINKALGVLSQKAEVDDVSLVDEVISYMVDTKQITQEELQSFKPGICNRLDRNTSGLIIAGKSLLGLQEMARILKDRTLDKYYLCIVQGCLKDTERVDGYLIKNEKLNKVTIHENKIANSDYICTIYQPLMVDSQERYTLVEVKLVTGKSHQIRAHLASLGHPLIGDFKYGNQKTNQYFKQNYGLSHQFLHSYKMIFPKIEGELSYLSGKEIAAPMPELFQKIKKDLF